MSILRVVPSEFVEFAQEHSYFVTYYGDIYSGTVCDIPGHTDSFFIVPNYRKEDYWELKNGGCKDLDHYRKVGWEIKDPDILSLDWIKKDERALGKKNDVQPFSKTNQEWKKLFIFGAGASAFCAEGGKNEMGVPFEDHPLCPPLGGSIFDDRFQEYRDTFPALKELAEEFNESRLGPEDFFQEQWSWIRHSYRPDLARKHIAAQFYLQKLFRDISSAVCENYPEQNLYRFFAEKLKAHLEAQGNEVATTVSFNYDTILEHFIEQSFGGLPDLSMESMIDPQKRKVLTFKPHGSHDQGWKLPFSLSGMRDYEGLLQRIFEEEWEPRDLFYGSMEEMPQHIARDSYGLHQNNAPRVDEGDHKEVPVGRHLLNKQDIRKKRRNEEFILPSLLLPFQNKDDLMMPDLHQQQMESFMEDAEELYIIGWKGEENVFNRRFEIKVGERLKRIVIVAANEKDFKDTKKILWGRLEKNGSVDLESIEWEYIKGFHRFIEQMESLLEKKAA